MRSEATEFLPLARREAIITKEVDGELLVYDCERDRAHCLNETAAAIWQLCDGRTSVGEISEQLAVSSEQKVEGSRQKVEGSRQKAVGRRQNAEDRRQKAEGSRQQTEGSDLSPVTRHLSPDVVWLALEQLRRSHLLEEAAEVNRKTFWPPAIAGITNMSRREAVRRIGLGAAIALPIVMSMTAPTAVEASVSCGAKCHPCSTSAECCGTSVCTTGVSGCLSGTRCT